MYDAVKRYNTPVVKLLIQHGALAQPRVLSHCETKLKDHKYVCLRDFKGTDDEIIVSYMVAKHGSVKDLGIYEVLERLVEDVDDSKLWTAKVEITMRDLFQGPNSSDTTYWLRVSERELVLVRHHLTEVCRIQLSIVLVQWGEEEAFVKYTGYDLSTDK
jgi:hypothetical protein